MLRAMQFGHHEPAGDEQQARQRAGSHGRPATQPRTAWASTLSVFGLCTLAVAQPLLDVLGRRPQFLVADHAQPLDILLLVVVVCVGVPAMLVAAEAFVGIFSASLRRVTHHLIVGGLIAVIALTVVKLLSPGLSGVIALVIAGVSGTLGAMAYWLTSPFRSFVSILAIGAIVSPAMFILNSGATPLIFPNPPPVAASATANAGVPVVVVQFDELPLVSLLDQDHQIDPNHFPNFADLAAHAYWFRNATTVADGTFEAIPSILTGTYPRQGLLPTYSDHPQNLFTLLRSSHSLHVHEPVTQLCHPSFCPDTLAQTTPASRRATLLIDASMVYLHLVLPNALTRYLPSVSEGWNDFAAIPNVFNDNFTDAALGSTARLDRRAIFMRFVESVAPSGSVPEHQPPLYYVHVLLPHVPWEYMPSGRTYGRRDTPGLNIGLPQGETVWGSDRAAILEGYQQHLLQAQLVDQLLGSLIARLKTEGLYDDALIVVLADHGITFQAEASRRRLTSSTLAELMAIPLLVKLPHQEAGLTSDRNVETIDILPTIADVIGVSIPWAVDGTSVFDAAVPERNTKSAVDYNFQAFTVTASEMPSLVKQAVSEKLAQFPSWSREDGLFRTGPYNALVGEPLDSLAVEDSSDLFAELDDPQAYEAVTSSAAFIPSRIDGRLRVEHAADHPMYIAVVVNQVVQAVVRPYAAGDLVRFSAVVADSAFREGRNDVSLLSVDGPGDHPRLASVGIQSGAQFALRTDADGRETLTTPGREPVPIVPGGLAGYVDAWQTRAGMVEIGGWAVDRTHPNSAATVAMLANGRWVGSVLTSQPRPDVVAQLLLESAAPPGFLLRAPIGQFDNLDSATIRLFAVSHDGKATELSYLQQFPWQARRGLWHRLFGT